mgnify:CR=1 FL=1
MVKNNLNIKTRLYADLILPLAVPKLLTYHIEKKANIEVGQRVLVVVGKQKQFSAIVFKIHDIKPNYDTKPILDILDENPIVNHSQLELWSWISRYYMTTIGEVMIAGLPNSLKIHSESKYLPASYNVDDNKISLLKENEQLIIDALEKNNKMTLKEISELLEISFPHPYIKNLIDKGYIKVYEEFHEKFRNKTVNKIDLAATIKKDENHLKNVFKLLSRAPKQEALLLNFLKLHQEISWKPVLQKKLLSISSASPAILKALIEKKILIRIKEEVGRIQSVSKDKSKLPVLSALQKNALRQVTTFFKESKNVLVHGVTGSGKTELYIHLIQRQISKGKKVLYLLPEIAITTQIIQRLQSYFGKRVGVYHSRFSSAERTELWYSLLDDKLHKFDIILGARSSIFLPLKDIGLIIVDEEHESSYKQFDPSPRYHARDVAAKLAHIHQSNLLLGSATPSLEMMQLVKENKLGYVELNKRYNNIPMPEIQCADLKIAHKKRKMKGIFSPLLFENIQQTLKLGKQIILFQNRRGYAPRIMCKVCGWTPKCKHCDVCMTMHKFQPIMKCHYCGQTQKQVKKCGACGSFELAILGLGTQKIEEEIYQHFGSSIRVKRMDWDTTRKKSSFQEIIDQFEQKEIDILVGTQMVSKGLDFDHVGLVGVLQADDMLYYPDFRAHERCFQLLTQVSGRSGRKNERGKVILQSFDPYHWVLQKVMEYDYKSLYKQELADRKYFNYPPFYRMIRITLLHKRSENLIIGSNLMSKDLKLHLGDRVLGPEFTIIPRIKNNYQQQIFLKIEKEISLAKVKNHIRKIIDDWRQKKGSKSIRLKIDVDPM